MSTAGWVAGLDLLAVHLERQEDAVERGAPELVTAFVPPRDLGPLPPGLEQRARELHARAEALTAAIAGQLEDTRAALAAGRQPVAPAGPVFVDSRC